MSTAKIAIPYYGSLTHPSTGFERVYFIVEQDENQAGRCKNISIGIWNSAEKPLLPSWFNDLGVQSLVCQTDPEANLLENLKNAGIKVLNEGNEFARRIMKQLNLI